jgi:hypothetical protein
LSFNVRQRALDGIGLMNRYSLVCAAHECLRGFGYFQRSSRPRSCAGSAAAWRVGVVEPVRDVVASTNLPHLSWRASSVWCPIRSGAAEPRSRHPYHATRTNHSR